MSTITPIAGTDTVTSSRSTINTNFSNLNTDKLEKTSNLSDLSNAGTARTNLGLGTLATQNGTAPSGSIVGVSDSQTLTNKTINLSSNTVSGTTAQFNTALSDGDFATLAGAETLTNKRITVRVKQDASHTTSVTMDSDSYDEYDITAQAGALLFNNPSGTPTNGQKLLVRIKDNGTARALTYGTQFASGVGTLPTTTVISKKGWIGFEWDSTDSKWYCIATGFQP